MADLTSAAIGTMANSIVAVSGNIVAFKATGAITGSDISSGMALGGSNIAAALADQTPLANGADFAAVLSTPTLFHGSIKSITGTTLLSSNLTAGVSPGADGVFGTSDDNVNTSLTGGVSAIVSAKIVADSNSHLIANSSGSGASQVTYTLDNSSNSIVSGDPVGGSPTATATPTTPAVIVTPQGTITVTVSGPVGTVVNLYDDQATTDRLDTMVISATGSSPVSVTVLTTSPTTYNLGRVLTTDGTNLASFTFNGSILGDVHGGPALWIDSDVTTFTVGSLPDDQTWSGQIGGNVSKMTIQQLGSGQLRVGGIISTLAITSSVGNPLLKQLGSVDPSTVITQVAVNPLNGNIYASDGQQIWNTDFTTGTVGVTTPVMLPNSSTPLGISGIAFDNNGNLLGISTINNQNPTVPVGAIHEVGNTLHGLAVGPLGQIRASDSSSGQDTLVSLDPTTGAETVIGVITDPSTATYSHKVNALAYDANGNLYALISSTNGEMFAQLTVKGSLVKAGAPGANSAGISPVLISGGGVTGTFEGFAVDGSGNFWAVRNVSGSDQLDQILVSGSGLNATALLGSVGTVSVDGGATSTQIVGMGFDEAGNLVALNSAGTQRELISISTTAPANSVRLDTPGLLTTSYAAFGVGMSGTNFSTYAYTTNSGGELFMNPGVVLTLGVISTTAGPTLGLFTQDLELVQDGNQTALSGTVRSAAVNNVGDMFVLMNNGQVFEYNTTTGGTLVGNGALGIIGDSTGQPLNVTQIMFTPGGQMVGLSETGNNLVNINSLPQIVGGQRVLVATNLTDIGTANPAQLVTLSYSSALGQYVSYDSATHAFESILGTSPATLGGLVAEGITSATLPSNFGERIDVNGQVASSKGGGSSIGSIKISGAGTFTGIISADGTIASVTASGTVFDGGVVAHGDLTSFAVTGASAGKGQPTTGGNIGADATIYAQGSLVKISTTGDFAGDILGTRAGAIAIGGAGTAGSSITVDNDITSLTINGQEAGAISAHTIGTLKIGGVLVQGASVKITGDASAVTLGGGTQLGSTFVDFGNITGSLNIGGILAGTVAVKRSVGTAVLATAINGLLDVGGSINSLTVSGNMTDSLISVGTWIGDDGVYNTADDVIFGGGINTAKINGVFTDSVIAAGVLPRIGVAAGNNNIPLDIQSYTGNPKATNVADISSAEAGGIYKSVIGNISFAKPVVSTVATGSTFSALVAADGITTAKFTGSLKQAVLTNPAGAPQVVLVTDPETGVVSPDITFVGSTEMHIVFDQPLDTATIGADTIQVINTNTGLPVTDLVFSYTTQIGQDGQTQGVVKVTSQSGFGGTENVQVTVVGGISSPTITDVAGLRSSLEDYDQDGVRDPQGDPFGATAVTQTYTVGAPVNDDFAHAILLSGNLPIVTSGTNVDATLENGEPEAAGNVGGASVWWKWVAPSVGSVTIDTEGSDFNTLLAVYTGSAVNSLTPVVSDDDVSPADLTSQVTFTAVAGQTYYISVDGFNDGTGAATGTIQLTIGIS